MTDEEKIKELTLLPLYMTSWQEKALGGTVSRTWKGYPFETLDSLEAEDMIYGSRRSKSVYLTEEGEQKAQELESKYFGSKVIPLRAELGGLPETLPCNVSLLRAGPRNGNNTFDLPGGG